jgi:segregation and condensation protein A
MPDYKVQLDVYNGPLDLLLFLIRRSELDIYDIPIAEITRQYCEYVTCLQQIDPDAAAEFLVLAATLMEIKSRMLLPRPTAEEGGELEELSDPRLELVRQLLEYKKFKDASLELGAAAALQAARWPRSPVAALAASPAAYDLEEVQVWDLVAAFNQLMVAIGRDRVTHDVVFDDTPIALHATDIQDRLSREGTLSFAAIFAGRGRAEMIGLFLALLELIRQRRVRVEQADVMSAIMIIPLNFDPITVGTEWEYRIAAEEVAVDDEPVPERAVTAANAELTLAVEPEDELDEVMARLDQIKTDVDIDLAADGVATEPRRAKEPEE